MKLSVFGEKSSAQLTSSAKVSRPKVTKEDFIRFGLFCEVINATDKRARNVTLNGEQFAFDELEVPACLASMIYPSCLTVTGDMDSEADFLSHDFGSILVNDTNSVVKETKKEIDEAGNEVEKEIEIVKANYTPMDGYEVRQFANALYNTWKMDAETKLVSDIRITASLTHEVAMTTCSSDKVAASNIPFFPVSTKVEFYNTEELAEDDVDRMIQRWIVKTLDKK